MHEGHRKRLKKRFVQEGLDNFESHQILELLLFYSIPRKDTNELAHLLINEYGSISNVLEADPKEIMKLKGVGENTAILLSLIPQLLRVYSIDKYREKELIDSSKKAGKYLIDLFLGRKYEIFYLVCLDAQQRVINAALVHEGTIDEVPIYPRIIVEAAIRHKSNSVILAHNHPSESLNISNADEESTKRIKIALNSVSIQVMDHIIISGNKYISFAEQGLL